MTIPEPTQHEVTELLVAWSEGNEAALERLLPVVYEELRRLARRHMRREHAGHTLQTTALVHEAYLRLVNQRDVRWQNRAHFFAAAAQLMRRILIDHARGRHRLRRGGGAQKVSLAEAADLFQKPAIDLLVLDEALKNLAEVDERQGRIVELRFFGGLSVEETAEVLKISPSTVRKDWTFAKAFLHRAMSHAT